MWLHDDLGLKSEGILSSVSSSYVRIKQNLFNPSTISNLQNLFISAEVVVMKWFLNTKMAVIREPEETCHYGGLFVSDSHKAQNPPCWISKPTWREGSTKRRNVKVDLMKSVGILSSAFFYPPSGPHFTGCPPAVHWLSADSRPVGLDSFTYAAIIKTCKQRSTFKSIVLKPEGKLRMIFFSASNTLSCVHAFLNTAQLRQQN